MITAPPTTPADPRRWITLGIVLTSILIAALDTTILNVAIPTILRELDTTLPALQWVMTGYTLTFAALLIIGGRLSDIFGARRVFIVGAALFGIGSFIASIANGVPMLVIGEAVIEGMGASLMIPATMGILSSTFTGKERSTAFGAWGAVMGAAVAFGPLLGGFLTTNYSWRWGFRINVIVVPFAILGALLVMPKVAPSGRRERIDVPGSFLIATGMLLLVFSISEGGTYGWFHPLQAVAIGGLDLWPAGAPVSIVPVTFVLAIALLVGFYVLERHKERAGTDPLFEFSQLRIRSFRWGIATLLLLAMGQISFLFVLSVFLQDSLHLSALDTGLWLVPSGLFIVAGSQLGARLTRSIGTTRVVRLGLFLEALGLGAVAFAVAPGTTFVELLPGFALFGVGIGFGGSQLTNVILAEIPPERSGAASGANSTVRMIGSSLGIATISTLLTTVTIRRADELVRSADLSPAVRDRALEAIGANGISSTPPTGISGADASALRHALDAATAAGARPALLFGTAVVTLGMVMSFLIPQLEASTDEAVLEVERESEAVAETASVT